MPKRYVDTYFDAPDEEENEQVVLDEEYLRRIEKLKLKDYLSYKPTRKILDADFDDFILHNLEGDLKDLFEDYRSGVQESQIDLLALSDETHYVDLLMMLKHHIVPKYSDEVFEKLKYNTDIMNGLLHKVDVEREKEEDAQKKQRTEEYLSKLKDKTFDWNTKKYE